MNANRTNNPPNQTQRTDLLHYLAVLLIVEPAEFCETTYKLDERFGDEVLEIRPIARKVVQNIVPETRMGAASSNRGDVKLPLRVTSPSFFRDS